MDGVALRNQWRALTKLFPDWSVPLDFFLNPSTYRFWGPDLIQSMLADWRVRRAAALLTQQPEMVGALAKLSQVNVARTNDAFKAVALIYISLPLGLAALVSDAAPEQARSAVTEYMPLVWPLLVGLILGPLHYFFSHWRAKQIAWVIELFDTGVIALPEKKRGGR